MLANPILCKINLLMTFYLSELTENEPRPILKQLYNVNGIFYECLTVKSKYNYIINLHFKKNQQH